MENGESTNSIQSESPFEIINSSFILKKNKETGIRVVFKPKGPGIFSGVLKIRHSDGVIKCLIFSEGFYADIRLVKIDNKPIRSRYFLDLVIKDEFKCF